MLEERVNPEDVDKVAVEYDEVVVAVIGFATTSGTVAVVPVEKVAHTSSSLCRLLLAAIL